MVHHLIFWLVVSLSLQLLLLVPFTQSNDPDPLQDFCVANLTGGAPSMNGFPCKPVSETASSDFFFDGLTKEGNTSNFLGYSLTLGNVLSFPGLNTLGISMNRVDFAPGGMSAPHTHPRSTEIGIVIKGTLLAGFVTTRNVFHSKIITAGEMFVVPRGLVHFQRNVGKGKAQTITAFNSHLPGSVMVANALFATNPPIPNEVLTQAYQVGDNVVNAIKSKF